MSQEEKKALVFELADTLLQSWWTIVAGISVGLAGTLIALRLINSVYMAAATILIIPQKIPEDLVQSTVTENMTKRMVALEEAVLSESYMRKLIDRLYGLPGTEEEIKSKIKSVRSRIVITPTVSDQTQMFAFELSFKDDDPERTALGANVLAELYIEQNTQFRGDQARDTARTLEARAAEARKELEEADRALAQFNARHNFESQGHLDANISLREGRARDLEAARARQLYLEQQLGDLQRRLEAETKLGSTAQALAQAQRELAELLRKYSPVHPSVKEKQAEIDDLSAAVAAGSPPPGTDATPLPPSPEVAALEGQKRDAERELAALKTTQARLEGEISQYERRISAAPWVQPELTRLENRHTLARERAEAAQRKADQARESEFMEESLRGERFELARRAEVPRVPIYPQPSRAVALGVIAGLLLFVGPLLARRYLNPLVSSEAGLRALTDIPVLVSIPRVQTTTTEGYAMRRFLRNLAFSGAGATLLLVTLVVLRRIGG